MRLALAISLVASVLDYSDFELLPVFILLVGLIAMQFSPLKAFSCLVTLLIGWWWLGESGLWPEMVVQYAIPEYSLPNIDTLFDDVFSSIGADPY